MDASRYSPRRGSTTMTYTRSSHSLRATKGDVPQEETRLSWPLPSPSLAPLLSLSQRRRSSMYTTGHSQTFVRLREILYPHSLKDEGQ